VKKETIKLMEEVAEKLIKKKKNVSVAESCTGGLLGAYLTYLPGSSIYFEGGMQTYSNEAKVNILGVESGTIEKYGAVSEETAIAMVKNVAIKLDTNFGLSITGIAGPEGGNNEKPVGTVWIALYFEEVARATVFQFSGDRQNVREKSCFAALEMLKSVLDRKID
jgi:nicotinamide-nucleotide amidase